MLEEGLYCLKLTHWKFSNGVALWDLVLFIPSALFLLLLLLTFPRSLSRLKNESPTIIRVYFSFTWLSTVVSTLACVVSFIGRESFSAEIFWVLLLFVYMFVEMNVLLFLLHGAMKDSRDSVKRSIILTALISAIYSIVQGVLQFYFEWDIHRGDGASIFYWLARGLFFFLIYCFIILLPFTRLKNKYPLPAKASFYRYITFLLTLNIFLVAGCLLVYFLINFGFCFIDLAFFCYTSLFPASIYLTFLFEFFWTKEEGANYYATINTAYEESTRQLSSDSEDDYAPVSAFSTRPPSSYATGDQSTGNNTFNSGSGWGSSRSPHHLSGQGTANGSVNSKGEDTEALGNPLGSPFGNPSGSPRSHGRTRSASFGSQSSLGSLSSKWKK